MPDDSILFLSRSEVRQCITMREAVALMKDAFVQLSSGEAVVPLRTSLTVPEGEGRVLFMPVAMGSTHMFGAKVVSIFKENVKRGLPTIHGLMMVSDGSTGEPRAIMDAEYITALRTGAASGLATDMLARKDAKVACVVGAGGQAVTQLEAMCAVRKIDRAYVIDSTPAKAAAFAERMSTSLGMQVVPSMVEQGIAEADIICTSTTSSNPVFPDHLVKPGTHINAVGAYRKDMCEIPHDTVRRSTLVVDLRAACLAEAGDITQPLEKGIIRESHIHAELGELVADMKPSRTSPDEITLFKSVGNAVQDLAVAAHIVQYAQEHNLGARVALA